MGETSKGKAKRMKNCTPSKIQSCIQTQPIMNPILKDAAPVTTSLYCFSTYMAETGQTKKSVDELGNLQLQYKRDIGIFQCDFWQVSTEGDAELAPGVPFVKVFDKCAPVADDCSSFGCCAISGYYCFETRNGKAKCMKNCTPSKIQSCIQTQPIMNP